MSDEIFREGGPHNIKKTGPDQYTMNVSFSKDVHGRTARECPDAACSPGYFKVKSGTGITINHQTAYCPYCRLAKDPQDFSTKEQIRYAKDLIFREAHDGVERMIKNALDLGPSGKKRMGGKFLSIEMSYKPGSKPLVHRPFEEDVRRDVICPHCTLDHSVYGLATWCPDCGWDIFLTHVQAELSVISVMLSDIDRRKESLGHRVASKDLENCLEDTVSIFEAVLRVEARRSLAKQSISPVDIDKFFKRIGNAFQNPERAQKIFLQDLNVSLFAILNESEVGTLTKTFEKRHPITHNLGVVDKNYIQRAQTAEREGREIFVYAEEIQSVIDLSIKIFTELHQALFSSLNDEKL